MFDHIGIRTTDRKATEDFFVQALAPLRVAVAMQGPHGTGLGQNGKPSLWFYEAADPPTPLHLAFTAGSRSEVDAFHREAINAGGKDNGEPDLRPHYHPHYYAAFVIAPDGHNVEAVCHMAEN